MSKLDEFIAQMSNESSRPTAFMAFAKERHFTGNWAGLKNDLYTKTHQQGELAGQTEDVQGIRFETEHDGQKGFVLMALSKSASKIGLKDLMQNAANLQVRVDQYNGYENLTLCTGQSDREVSEVSGSFAI